MIHTVKGFCMVNKAAVGIFLEFSCFFEDPMDDGNLISGSSAFWEICMQVKKQRLELNMEEQTGFKSGKE